MRNAKQEYRNIPSSRSTIVKVNAACWWNSTRLEVRTGERYYITADGEWRDGAIRTTATGYTCRMLA
jgi:hypothetical protein